MRCAFAFARLNAGSIIAARIATMASTTITVIRPLAPRRTAATMSIRTITARTPNRIKPKLCSMRLP